MPRLTTIKLSRAEAYQIISMIAMRQQNEWHYGNKAQFEKRERVIRDKVLAILEGEQCQSE